MEQRRSKWTLATPIHFYLGLLIAAVLISVGLVACTGTQVSETGKPMVTIQSPASGSTYTEGEQVAVQSTATDALGVVRVELWVDNALVHSDSPPVEQGQTSFTLIQTWTATPGQHTLIVRAYNTQNVVSDPTGITLTVNPAQQSPVPATDTPTPTLPSPVPPTAIPSTTASPSPGACTNNAAFVADVTIPDGTAIGPGQAFLKTWRLSNIGSCAWDSAYTFAFTSGTQMGGATPVAVSPTAPGATVDISITMIAPAAPGRYTGYWRMRGSNGAYFGETVRVVIVVPKPPTPEPVCPGPPVIAFFTASPQVITQGGSSTLSWGAVTNADAVYLDGQGVATPGSRGVSPGTTTTYMLTATGCGGTAQAQAVVTVQQGCPGPPHIGFITVSPNTITAGQSATLSWGAVTNANTAVIDNGIGGVATPGSTSVAPGSTTTYTLTASGCGGTVSKSATLTVRGGGGINSLSNLKAFNVSKKQLRVTADYTYNGDHGSEVYLDAYAEDNAGNTAPGTYYTLAGPLKVGSGTGTIMIKQDVADEQAFTSTRVRVCMTKLLMGGGDEFLCQVFNFKKNWPGNLPQ